MKPIMQITIMTETKGNKKLGKPLEKENWGLEELQASSGWHVQAAGSIPKRCGKGSQFSTAITVLRSQFRHLSLAVMKFEKKTI